MGAQSADRVTLEDLVEAVKPLRVAVYSPMGRDQWEIEWHHGTGAPTYEPSVHGDSFQEVARKAIAIRAAAKGEP